MPSCPKKFESLRVSLPGPGSKNSSFTNQVFPQKGLLSWLRPHPLCDGPTNRPFFACLFGHDLAIIGKRDVHVSTMMFQNKHLHKGIF
jgi:hypothetical protein